MDICGGMGGDLSRFSRYRVESLVLVDIAENSVRKAEDRYKELPKHRTYNARFCVAGKNVFCVVVFLSIICSSPIVPYILSPLFF